VLREIRAARAQEAQAQEDAPMVGMVAHVLGTLALVGAGIVFAALLDLDVTMGTTASWVAPGAVAFIGGLLAATHL
jgi:Na+(H+)/acetate symporter ActP